jgi:hypothetical protein
VAGCGWNHEVRSRRVGGQQDGRATGPCMLKPRRPSLGAACPAPSCHVPPRHAALHGPAGAAPRRAAPRAAPRHTHYMAPHHRTPHHTTQPYTKLHHTGLAQIRVYYFANQTVARAAGDSFEGLLDGAALSARFNSPSGLALDPGGTGLWIAVGAARAVPAPAYRWA